jgi:hypothetical protein
MAQPPNAMGILEDLGDVGVLNGYHKYVLALEPLLEAMSKRGMPVHPASHAAVTADLTERAHQAELAMQALIPDEVRTCAPKLGYKRAPKDTTGLVKRWFALTREHEEAKSEWTREERWCRLNAWKPSHDGLIRYMLYRKHPIPTDYKSGKQLTTEVELKRLAKQTRDFLYDAVLEYRQISTVLNNHLPNWAPSPDGRVHPTFYYDTGTGQLASRRPNAQNAPKHGEGGKKDLADQFRSLVQAKPHHTLVEFDYRSFHAQTLAFEAQDKDYLRLAKLDIHSYLTAHLVKDGGADRALGLPDAELAGYLARIKRDHRFVRDFKAKRAILGYGFGMGYRKLFNMYREAFDSQADAKHTIDMLNGLFPRANTWRDEIRRQAHEQGYLLSRAGCIRWFWEVFRWKDGRWDSGGDDSEAAVAFLPANDAFCHIKDAMLRLDATGALQRFGLINQIHDALMFECPDHLLDECIVSVKGEMERPSDILINPIAPDGLSVEVGVSCGKSWEKMAEVK